MPLYAYRCSTCGSPFEALRRMSQADEPADCPACQTPTGRREMAAPAPAGRGRASAGASGCAPRGGFT